MDPEARTDFGTTRLIVAIGGSANPLIIHDSEIKYVDAHFAPDLFVVFDSSCSMVNYNQDFGDNVTIKCSPKIEPTDDEFTVVQSFGSDAHPIVFFKELFWRCTIDCNKLYTHFNQCEFVECEFRNNENTTFNFSPFITVDQFRLSKPMYHVMPGGKHRFHIDLGDKKRVNGYVVAQEFRSVSDSATAKINVIAEEFRSVSDSATAKVNVMKSKAETITTSVMKKMAEKRRSVRLSWKR